jgi:hypothetical protein
MQRYAGKCVAARLIFHFVAFRQSVAAHLQALLSAIFNFCVGLRVQPRSERAQADIHRKKFGKFSHDNQNRD